MKERPIALTIFGILNIGFALLGLLTLAVMTVIMPQLNASQNPSLQHIAHLLGGHASGAAHILTWLDGAASVVLLVAGVGLLTARNWARTASVGYGIYAIIAPIVGCIASLKSGDEISDILMAVVGVFFAAIYPALLIFFMMRPKVVAACKPATPEV